jgi:hypothetical protein
MEHSPFIRFILTGSGMLAILCLLAAALPIAVSGIDFVEGIYHMTQVFVSDSKLRLPSVLWGKGSNYHPDL